MVLNMLSQNCVLHDLGTYALVKGKGAVAKFYFDFLKSIPDDAQFVLDDTTGCGSGNSLGALWHLELGAYELPRAKGVSFYKFDNQGKIEYIRESPEPLLKMARLAIPSLRLAVPIVQTFAPLAIHQAQQFAKMMNFWESMQTTTDPVEVINRTLQLDVPTSPPIPTQNETISVDVMEPEQDQQPFQQVQTDIELIKQFNGRWKKIPEKSEIDMYHQALNLLQLPDLFKNAAKQIDCVVIERDEKGMSQGFATIVPIKQFQVTEIYKLNKEVAMNRRDYKSGKQFAKMQENDLSVSVDIWWDDPNKGGVVEEFWLNDERNLLNIRSTVTVGSMTIATLQVYRRISQS
eukprot:TRINITY_DN2508_c0_g1_i5.p1 TRINITY_DN2508_c0_g1~~TRINITY_DN2508_c0_g1_i5.p1  ORF type:complete len:347 (+),score=46.38 TRINITY_DN2508_c0_g1_i5:25-1065(+)